MELLLLEKRVQHIQEVGRSSVKDILNQGERHTLTVPPNIHLYSSSSVARDVCTDKNICVSSEEAEAFLALMQLRQLRKAWIGDWNYGVSSNQFLYAICHTRDGSLDVISTFSLCSLPLTFPTKEMAADFLNCFIDLCEVAKILI